MIQRDFHAKEHVPVEQYEDIYEEYYGKILAYIRGRTPYPQDAEDLCSAVFEKVLENLNTYDADRASVATWIYRIARNTVADYYRNQRTDETLDEELPGLEYADDALLRRETLSALANALKHLRQQERDIIILHYYTGCSLKEISERMGIPYRTVKLRKQTALERLRFLMRNEL